ncbi:MAG: UDP-N-acetylglucosamine 2-epimerase (non-hydrolyzing) [Candidatus Hydrogenedentota bacterium]|nr:MAG: UDP-N-acetylglucosamine 2-epimerase (non-hydrolyzing) [Candidatus Hydrogenedentota bacterium]
MTAPLTVLSVVGTRPNFIKEFVIDRACREAGIRKVLVHTGQHYDYKMSRLFFEELSLPQPDYVCNLIKGTHATETAAMLVFLEDVLKQERPDVTLVYGDVNSTVAGALASAKLGIPVAHVEAGLRCNIRNNPEEINRRIADTLASFNFAHIPSAYASLEKEGFPKDSIFLTGDVHKDAVDSIRSEYNIQTSDNGAVLVTLHRAENTDSHKRLGSIVKALLEAGRPIRFPLHPRTRNALEEGGLLKPLTIASHITLLEPLGYISFLRELASCSLLLSDSGGARREAYLLGKKVVSLIELPWVPEMIESGWEIIAGADPERIRAAVGNFPEPRTRPDIFGDGKAGEKIVSILCERFGRV